MLLIWSGVMLALLALFVPETYNSVCLKHKAQKLRKETGDRRLKAPMELLEKSLIRTLTISIMRPIQLLILEPMVLNLCLYSAILLGIQYLFFGAFPLVFSNNHEFDLAQDGMVFLGILVGMLTGICCDPLFHKYYMHLLKQRELAGGEPGGSEPEFRLPPLIIGAPLVTIGIFWFGWTTYSSVPWIVPIIGSGVYGMGQVVLGSLSKNSGCQLISSRRTVLSFSGIFTFLVDAYPLYAASALGANSFARSNLGGKHSNLDQSYSSRANVTKRRFRCLVSRCTMAWATNGQAVFWGSCLYSWYPSHSFSSSMESK